VNDLTGAWGKKRKTDEYKELNLEEKLTLNSFTNNIRGMTATVAEKRSYGVWASLLYQPLFCSYT